MRRIYTLLFIGLLFFQCEKDSSSSVSPATTTQGQGGSLARFAIAGNYLYSVDDQRLKVFDITNAAAPVLKNTIDIGFSIETIFPFKDKLFIGSATVVYIYSITDPVNPNQLSTAISPSVLRRCDPVVAKDTVAFATLNTAGPCGGSQSVLVVYDIKDITNPIQRAVYPVSQPYGLGYENDVLYVCDRQQGLLVFDIADPYNPQLIKKITDGAYTDVIPYQNTLICWVSTGMILYDITDNLNPKLVASIN